MTSCLWYCTTSTNKEFPGIRSSRALDKGKLYSPQTESQCVFQVMFARFQLRNGLQSADRKHLGSRAAGLLLLDFGSRALIISREAVIDNKGATGRTKLRLNSIFRGSYSSTETTSNQKHIIIMIQIHFVMTHHSNTGAWSWQQTGQAGSGFLQHQGNMGGDYG